MIKPVYHALLLSTLPFAAQAELLLAIGDTTPDGRTSLVVSYRDEGRPAAELSPVESILISGRYADLHIEEQPDGFSVELKPVVAAGVPATQVIVTPAGDHATISLSARPVDATKSANRSLAPRISILFADQPTSIATSAKAKGVFTPPVAAGDWRVGYRQGNRLLMVEAEAVGSATFAASAWRVLHHGAAIPVGGTTDSGVWCYAPLRESLASETDSVFITTGGGSASPVMATRAAFATLTPAGTEVALSQSLTHAPNLVYDRSSIRPVGERILIHGMQPGQNKSVLIPFTDHLTSTTLTLTVEVHGRNAGEANPDHFADFTLQGVATPSLSWEGRTIAFGTSPLTLGSTTIAGGQLTLTHAVPTGSPFDGSTDLQGLEAVTVAWEGYPRLSALGFRRLELPAAGAPRRVSIGGIPAGLTTADFALLDVTNPEAPIRIGDPVLFTDGAGTQAVEVEVGPDPAVLHLELLSAAESPRIVAAAMPLPPTPAGDAELRGVYIRPASLAATLAPLVALRGVGIVEFDPQAAYDSFNGGQESPEAIRDAIRWYVENSQSAIALPEVLLVGHGSLDRANDLGLQTGAQVPSFVEEGTATASGVRNENPNDFPYTLLLGDDDFPDAVVGRIPARTPAELQVAIDRQLAFEAALPALKAAPRKGMFVTDDDPEFLGDTALWLSLWEATGRPSVRLDVDPVTETGGLDGAAERAVIKAALEGESRGLAYLMYMGHGNTDRWSGHRIVRTQDIATFTTRGQWPFVATFTCLNAFYASPTATTQSLSEAWCLTPQNGAIANLAPNGVDFYPQQRAFAQRVMQRLALPPAQRPITVGEIVSLAQIDFLTDLPAQRATAAVYVLFGDPGSSLTLDPPAAATASQWMLLGE